MGIACLALLLGNALPALAETTIRVVHPPIMEVDGDDYSVLQSTEPAILEIESDQPFSLQFLSLQQTSGPSADPSGTHRELRFRTLGRSGTSNESIELPAGVIEVEVDLRIVRPGWFPAGTYSYGFNVVAD